MHLHEIEAKHEELLIAQGKVIAKEVRPIDHLGWEEAEFESVTRNVEGALGSAVRKRLAIGDVPVLITETAARVHLSDISTEMDYKTVIECGGRKKEFNTENPAYNFQALLDWLDETPGS